MILELAQLTDLDAINRLAKQATELHALWRPDLFQNADESFSVPVFLDLQKDKELYVVRSEEAVVAFTRIRIQPIGRPDDVPVRKVLFLEELCVDEKLRHRGIGTQMMNDLKAMAKAQGCISICLSVFPQNENAVSFYQKCGFDVTNIAMRCGIE